MTHTATPWEAIEGLAGWQIHEARENGGWIANMKCDHCGDGGKANAGLIVTAVNSHDGLLEALNNLGDNVTDMFEQMTRGNWVDDHGHSVLMNAKMIALKNSILEAQAAIKAAKE